jgi:hypothetical protein
MCGFTVEALGEAHLAPKTLPPLCALQAQPLAQAPPKRGPRRMLHSLSFTCAFLCPAHTPLVGMGASVPLACLPRSMPAALLGSGDWGSPRLGVSGASGMSARPRPLLLGSLSKEAEPVRDSCPPCKAGLKLLQGLHAPPAVCTCCALCTCYLHMRHAVGAWGPGLSTIAQHC